MTLEEEFQKDLTLDGSIPNIQAEVGVALVLVAHYLHQLSTLIRN